MALSNPRFAREQDLEDCLRGTKRLEKGSRGEAVRKVQQALIDLKDPKIRLPNFGADGKYGDETVAAVFQFKSDRGIVNAGGFIDGIVGPKTMDALDKTVFPGDGPSPTPPAPPPPTATKIADIVVRILNVGTGKESGVQKNRGVFFTEKYKALNRDLFGIQFDGGSGANNPSAAIVTRVEESLQGHKPGAICVFGGSVAGKNVLEVATRLNGKGIPRAYLGMSDGAFFDADALPPGGLIGVPIPVIKDPGAFADRRVNIFQSFGNNTKFSGSLQRRIWFGDDPRPPLGEIHGTIPGWENSDLTIIGNIKGPDPAIAHNQAVAQGNATHETNIIALLEKLAKS